MDLVPMTMDNPSNPDSPNPGKGPVGQGDYIVRAGDDLFSIAYDAGHDWQHLWNLGANADLKRIREHPNRLLPGDRLTVPAITIKQVSGTVDAQHKFRVKNVPLQLLLRIMKPPDLTGQKAAQETDQEDAEEALNVTGADPDAPAAQDDTPWAGVDYTLDIDSVTLTGQTDGDGKITVDLPPGATLGTLRLNLAGRHADGSRTIPLFLGSLAPHHELTGIKQRLLHLGFDCGDTNNQDQSDAFAAAVQAYREKAGLGAGGIDDPLINKLLSDHGS